MRRIERREQASLTEYPVIEIFHSIQGEGAFTGHRAVFIRLAGCDVGCEWCDTMDSWQMERGTVMGVEEIGKQIKAHLDENTRMVVVTGGEPLLHDLTALTSAVKELGLRRHLETSGAYPLSGEWDWIVLSPKKWFMPEVELFSTADEVKIIVAGADDLAFCEYVAKLVGVHVLKFVQPEWSVRKRVLPLLVSFLQAHPDWQLSLQVHKYLGVP